MENAGPCGWLGDGQVAAVAMAGEQGGGSPQVYKDTGRAFYTAQE